MTITDFKILLSQSKYLEIRSPQKNMTLVHVACSYGHLDILKALLELSAELINQQDVEGWSPAHCAVAEGHISVLLLLGKYGPLIGKNLWEFYADYPMDLDLKTEDGESIEEVSMPEIQQQVVKIMNGMSYRFAKEIDLRSLQEFASTVDPGYRPNKIFSDPEISVGIFVYFNFEEECSFTTSSNKDILGSITEALNLSNDSSLASQFSLNQHLDTQNSLIIHSNSKYRC